MLVSIDHLKLNKEGCLKAFVDITFSNDLRVNGCRIIQEPGKAAWLAAPQIEWIDDTGKKRYRPLVRLPKDWHEAAQTAALAALREATGEVKGNE